MTELELLQQISDRVNQLNTNLTFIAGIITGAIIGLIFWNIVKEVE
jgi:hypothetical protein